MSTRLLAADEYELRSLIERYQDRFNAGDADGLAQIYAADISFVNLGGAPFIGRGAIVDQQAEGFRGLLGRITIALEVDSTSALGADHALALIRQSIDNPDAVDGVTPQSTMSMILDRTSGSWLIRHLQSTPILRR